MNSVSDKPRILILGSGSPEGGGSGPRMLIENVKQRVLNTTILGLVTHYPNGGVARLGDENKDLFETHIVDDFPIRKKGAFFSKEQISKIEEIYSGIINNFGGIDNIDYILLSGWMKLVLGLPVEKVVNIHPSRVDKGFGGDGKYGDFAHMHAFDAYKNGEIKDTAITMHFVDEQYDHGPVTAQQRIRLNGCNSWEEAKSKVVGSTEHRFQLAVTKAILDGKVVLHNGKVFWDEDFIFENPDYYKGEIDWEEIKKI